MRRGTVKDLTSLSNFKGIRIVADESLKGQNMAEMRDGEDVIRVSPAMYRLLETDRDEILQKLKVKILPAAKK